MDTIILSFQIWAPFIWFERSGYFVCWWKARSRKMVGYLLSSCSFPRKGLIYKFQGWAALWQDANQGHSEVWICSFFTKLRWRAGLKSETSSLLQQAVSLVSKVLKLALSEFGKDNFVKWLFFDVDIFSIQKLVNCPMYFCGPKYYSKHFLSSKIARHCGEKNPEVISKNRIPLKFLNFCVWSIWRLSSG